MLSYCFAPEGGSAGRGHWNQAMREVYGPRWSLNPLRPPDFRMSMQAVQVGELTLSHASLSEAEITTRVQQFSNKSARSYNIYTVNSLQNVVVGGQALDLTPGDFTLADSMVPSTIVTNEPYATIGITVPAHILRTYLPKPERAIGVRFSGTEGLPKVVSTMLRDMWTTAERGATPCIGSKLMASLFEAFSACCDLSQPRVNAASGNATTRRIQICESIQQHLRESELTVQFLAQKLGLSTRYIRMVFNDGGETIAQYIHRLRLEGCHRDLADPAWMDHSVSAIAYRWGFNSTAHFSRTFRATFGASPTQFRDRIRLDG